MICKRCESVEARPKELYCKGCKKLVLKELRDAGYLEPFCRGMIGRPVEKREVVRETKYGIDR